MTATQEPYRFMRRGLWITASLFVMGCGNTGFNGKSRSHASGKDQVHVGGQDAQAEAPQPADEVLQSGADEAGDTAKDADTLEPSQESTKDAAQNLATGADQKDDAKPDATIEGDILTVHKNIARIEVSVTLDHVTDFVITSNSIYFVHRHLGFPGVTDLKLYDETGQLIDTKNYLPRFKVGQGANCPNITNLKNPGECISIPVKIPGHKLAGKLAKKLGRGYVGLRHHSGSIVVSAYDCGADCGSPGGGSKLSGVSQYTWIVE